MDVESRWRHSGPIALLALLVLPAGRAIAAEHIAELLYEEPKVTRITVAGSTVTRTDWVCKARPPSTPASACGESPGATRSWALTGSEADALSRSLLASGLLADAPGTGSGDATSRAGERLIEVHLQEATAARVVRRAVAGETASDGAFDAAAAALLALVPPVFAPPVRYQGLAPQRAGVELVLEGAGRYRLELKIVPLKNRPTGGAREAGRWEFDATSSRLRLIPDSPGAKERAATLTGGRRPQAILGLEGYFPPGTMVTLQPQDP